MMRKTHLFRKSKVRFVRMEDWAVWLALRNQPKICRRIRPVTVTVSVWLIVLAQVHSGLALVMGSWALGYVIVSYVLAIRCREYARKFAAARSAVSGKIVDAVTNVMNSKLFARNEFERGY